MNNEYVIINKSLIEKRIEELVKELAYHEEWYKKARDNYHNDKKNWGQADDGEMRAASDAASTTAQEIKVLKQILSQSTPLIPEINAAIEFGKDIIGSNTFISTDENGTPFIDYFDTTTETNHYISNLKLDI
jgi:hypothetical protein